MAVDHSWLIIDNKIQEEATKTQRQPEVSFHPPTTFLNGLIWRCESKNDFYQLYSAVRADFAAADSHSASMSGRNPLPKLFDGGAVRRVHRPGIHDRPVHRPAHRRGPVRPGGGGQQLHAAVWIPTPVSGGPLQLPVSPVSMLANSESPQILLQLGLKDHILLKPDISYHLYFAGIKTKANKFDCPV